MSKYKIVVETAGDDHTNAMTLKLREKFSGISYLYTPSGGGFLVENQDLSSSILDELKRYKTVVEKRPDGVLSISVDFSKHVVSQNEQSYVLVSNKSESQLFTMAGMVAGAAVAAPNGRRGHNQFKDVAKTALGALAGGDLRSIADGMINGGAREAFDRCHMDVEQGAYSAPQEQYMQPKQPGVIVPSYPVLRQQGESYNKDCAADQAALMIVEKTGSPVYDALASQTAAAAAPAVRVKPVVEDASVSQGQLKSINCRKKPTMYDPKINTLYCGHDFK